MASDRPAAAGTASGAPLSDELLFWLGDEPERDVVPDRVTAAPVAAPAPAVVEAPAPRSTSPEPARAVTASPARASTRRRRLVTLLGAVAAGAVVFGVYSAGKPAVPTFAGQADEQTSSSASQAPVDRAQVTALMKKISADPRDVASLQALGDLYFQAGDYKNASLWEKKVLAIDPKNVTALLGLGASQFNLGNAKDAEQSWLRVTALDPKKAEAHYDLGFLYLSQTPTDMAKVRSEWQQVVAIDPTSDIAKTVSAHLKSLQSTPAPGTAGK